MHNGPWTMVCSNKGIVIVLLQQAYVANILVVSDWQLRCAPLPAPHQIRYTGEINDRKFEIL